MTITIKPISAETFQAKQDTYSCAHFAQSLEMVELQAGRQNFFKTDLLGFFDDNTLVGQAAIYYRKRYRFFTEALIINGPLLAYGHTDQVLAAFQALISYCKQQGVDHLSCYPYVINQIKNLELKPVQIGLQTEIIEQLKQLGFQHSLDPSQTTTISQIFVKDLTAFKDTEELFADFTPALKRDIKKFTEAHVHTKELEEKDLALFYDILKETGQRKQFHLQDFAYFKALKQTFQDRARFILAYLDAPAYAAYLADKIAHFEEQLVSLEQKPASKRTKGTKADATDQLMSYRRRQDAFQALRKEQDHIPLSAYLFISQGKEIISFAGGSYADYINFGGATLINWQMMQEALNQGIERYNFYGTIETEQADSGMGNFKFKSQFGGHLEELIGIFNYTLNPIYKLITRLKA